MIQELMSCVAAQRSRCKATAARMYSSRVSSRVLRKQFTTFLSAEVIKTLSMSAACTILHILAALCVALLDASMHAQAGAAAGAPTNEHFNCQSPATAALVAAQANLSKTAVC
jgi:hypothetical protein